VGGSGPKGPDFAGGPVESGRGPMTIRGSGECPSPAQPSYAKCGAGQLVHLPHHGVLVPALALPSRME
jgi:hypothetical protein